MAHDVAYFLCATPRSGTTMLCDLLSGTGRAGRPQSYFRRQDVNRRAVDYGLSFNDFPKQKDFERAYLHAVLRDGANGTSVLGLRIMWGTVKELAERLSWLHPGACTAGLFEQAFGPIIFIHVSRRDKVAQAVSLLKAEQSGLWHLAADGTERQRTAPAAPLSYDAERIADLVAELGRDDAAWNSFFAENGIAPVRVEYESLAARPRTEVRKILEALHISPGLADALQVKTSKMADDESNDWSARFHLERIPGRA